MQIVELRSTTLKRKEYTVYGKYDTKRRYMEFIGTLSECAAFIWLKENGHIIK